jgi:hypothetical protein
MAFWQSAPIVRYGARDMEYKARIDIRQPGRWQVTTETIFVGGTLWRAYRAIDAEFKERERDHPFGGYGPLDARIQFRVRLRNDRWITLGFYVMPAELREGDQARARDFFLAAVEASMYKLLERAAENGSDADLEGIAEVAVVVIYTPAIAGGCDSHEKHVSFENDAKTTSLKCMSHKATEGSCGAQCVLYAAQMFLQMGIANQSPYVSELQARIEKRKTTRGVYAELKIKAVRPLTYAEIDQACAFYTMGIIIYDGSFDIDVPRIVYQARTDAAVVCRLVHTLDHYFRVRDEPSMDKCSSCGKAIKSGRHRCVERCAMCGLPKADEHVCQRKRQKISEMADAILSAPMEEEKVHFQGEIPVVSRPIVPYERKIVPERQPADILAQLFTSVQAGRSVLLHGPGGTGKTTIIQEFLRLSVAQGLNVGICASTAIAAIALQGCTAHRLFGINSRKNRREIGEVLAEYDVVIVEEISMIGAATYDEMSKAAQRARKSPLPFGGLAIIHLGDSLQLPPVKQEPWFTTNTWRKLETTLDVIALDKTYRFPDHPWWADMLSKIRLGIVEKPMIDYLKTRVFSGDVLKVIVDQLRAQNVTHVEMYARNKQADKINEENLALLSGDPVTYIPMFSTSRDKEFFSYHKDLPTVTIKVGAKVMLRCNDYVDEYKLANGSIGTVYGIGVNEVGVDFGTATVIIKLATAVAQHGHDRYSYQWMPLTVSYALSIHKMQGTTIRVPCITSLGKDIFESSQAYVALSRISNPELLFLRDFDPNCIKVKTAYREFSDWCVDRPREHYILRPNTRLENDQSHIRVNELANCYEVIVADEIDDEVGLDPQVVVHVTDKSKKEKMYAIIYDYETFFSESRGGIAFPYGCRAKVVSYEYDKKEVKTQDGKSFSSTYLIDSNDPAEKFCEWVMELVEEKRQGLNNNFDPKKRSKNKPPYILCAYNGNNFDHTWLQRYVLKHDLPGISVTMTARGTSSMVTMSLIDRESGTVMLRTHDLCDILKMSLSDACKNYVPASEHKKKGHLPHNYLNDNTYFNLVEKNIVSVTLEDFPTGDRAEVAKLVKEGKISLERYDLFKEYDDYFNADVDILAAVYKGFEKICFARVKASCFNFATMALMTWYGFVTNLESEFTQESLNKSLARRRLKLTQIYTITREENQFVGQAIYGGCVLPRIKEFKSADYGKPYAEIKDYLMYVDICSMYVAIMINELFPWGPHRHANEEMLAGYGMLLNERGIDELPMGIYEIEFRFDPLEVHPCVPHRDAKKSLRWSNCAQDEDGGYSGKYIRGIYTNIDIRNIVRSKGQIKPLVHKAIVWAKKGKVFSKWASKTFAWKCEGAKMALNEETKDAGKALKLLGKLLGNACYGVSAQKDYRSGYSFVRDNADLMDFYKHFKWEDTPNAERYASGKDTVLLMKGEPLDNDENIMTSKPRYMGAFVLSYSRQMINELINDANPFNRTDFVDELGRRLASLCQPYYGDTDSLMLPAACGPLILKHFLPIRPAQGSQPAEREDVPGKLGDDLNKGESEAEKKMMVTKDEDGVPMFVKVISGCFLAPKTYAVEYIKSDDSKGSTVKSKGIPNHKTNDIKVSYTVPGCPPVVDKTKFEYSDFLAVKDAVGMPEFEGITIGTRKFAKRGTKSNSKLEGTELYTISSQYLARTIFTKSYEGRKQLSEGSPITVPHGYGEYRLGE